MVYLFFRTFIHLNQKLPQILKVKLIFDFIVNLDLNNFIKLNLISSYNNIIYDISNYRISE
jgi:hypothetical protein